MKNLLIAIIVLQFVSTAHAQWNGQTSSTDLTSPINRTGIVNLDGHDAAQMRLNSQGAYYGKIGNPSPQVWSLGWGGSGTDITPLLNWTSLDRVGIGTTSPAYKFHISAADISVQQRFQRTGSGAGITDMGTDDQGFNVFVGGYSAPSLRVLFGANGNLGIGSSTPALAKLHVVSDNISIQQRFQRTGTGAGITDIGTDDQGFNVFVGGYSAPSLRVLFGANGNLGVGSSTPSAKLHVASDNSSIQQRFQRTGSGGGITDLGTDDQGFNVFVGGYSAPSLRVLFGANGNLGIGSSTPPLAKLHVVSDNTSIQQRFQRTGSGTGITDIGTDDQGFKIFVGGYNAPSLKVLYGSNGKVGIGTFSPDAELTVNGSIHTKEVRVDVSIPAPDYVFEPNYDLPTLAETETYIKENKHLPEVPSAKQMTEEGLNLKEMNLLLLKKVEELTLHLIQENKEINELKTENKKLSTRVTELEKR
jgi:hypothetical protein